MNSPPLTADNASPPGTAVERLLRRLRHQLREAIAARLGWQAAATLALVGWSAVILDRLIEPAASVRITCWAGLALAGVAWLAAVVVPRLARSVTDRQIVTFLHQDHPREAGLVSTALDLHEAATSTTSESLAEATLKSADAAAEQIADVRLVRSSSAMGSVGFAAVALAAAIGFASIRPDMASCFARRVALSEEPWPRRVQLVAEGFERDPARGEWTRVVPRGEPADFTILAQVEGKLPPPATLWARDPQRRRVETLTRIGQPTFSEGTTEQAYRRRIERLDVDRAITVSGGDARLRLRLVAADRPRLVELAVTTTPPKYLDEPPKTLSPATLGPVPEGGWLRLTARSTKPLKSVTAVARPAASTTSQPLAAVIDTENRSVAIKVPALEEATVVTVTTIDRDGLASEPFELSIEIAKDQPPTIGLALDGVGRAVTRDARLVIALTPDDDHGLRSIELRLRRDEREVVVAVTPPDDLPAGVRAEADLLSMRSLSAEERLAVQPGDRLVLTALVSDRYDLQERPPTESRSIELEIVTPAELLARISDAQRDLRQTIEGLLADVQRLEYELDLQQRREAEGLSEERDRWTAERLLDLRKASDGISDAADRTGSLRVQVENNRLDQPALIDRLERRVAGPLRQVVQEELSIARNRLTDNQSGSTDAALARVRSAAVTLEEVAGNLETQQTYNEVVALLRGLIREQRRVNQRTERQEGESVRSLFD